MAKIIIKPAVRAFEKGKLVHLIGSIPSSLSVITAVRSNGQLDLTCLSDGCTYAGQDPQAYVLLEGAVGISN